MYEWDETKSQENLSKHGLSFDDAETVFSGPCVTFEDTRFDYGAPRFITLGRLEGHVVVAHTPHSAISHAMNPMLASASLAPTRWFT